MRCCKHELAERNGSCESSLAVGGGGAPVYSPKVEWKIELVAMKLEDSLPHVGRAELIPMLLPSGYLRE